MARVRTSGFSSSRAAIAVNLTEVGGRLPFYATSSGIVLLAFSPPDVRDRALSTTTGHRPPLARGSIVGDLSASIDLARRQGFAVTRGLIRPEAAAVAVPIFDSLDVPLAALAFVVSTGDSYGGRLDGLLDLLKPAAKRIAVAVRRGQSNVS
ncbi:IclR family transcriptional regulator domain-containing protein [Cryobacterium glaciale]|uniref:IclR family transcriptional regulator domain-containing protein n=1 Tax=Cryobacterium glaciale TaxID=1259145 RepID=UPI003B9788A9